jgi:hypothetical protein
MTFTREFLKELQKRLANSDSNSYPMTKKQVQILTNMRLMETDKNVIFSSLIDDISRYKDPESLSIFWNEQINDQNFKFKF